MRRIGRYLPIDKRGADLLFQIISQRYERGSIVFPLAAGTYHRVARAPIRADSLMAPIARRLKCAPFLHDGG
ncbi:MAG: hypothetical protein JXQ73_08630 [Phycisphaerae bacterium]|nr:hypothetical protein [Phycisphaerae bacterium]